MEQFNLWRKERARLVGLTKDVDFAWSRLDHDPAEEKDQDQDEEEEQEEEQDLREGVGLSKLEGSGVGGEIWRGFGPRWRVGLVSAGRGRRCDLLMATKRQGDSPAALAILDLVEEGAHHEDAATAEPGQVARVG